MHSNRHDLCKKVKYSPPEVKKIVGMFDFCNFIRSIPEYYIPPLCMHSSF